MDEKKKLLIVGVLAVVMISVGVFTFTRGGEEPVNPDENVAMKSDKSDAPAASVEEPVKNPLLAMGLPARDPFSVPVSPVMPTGAGNFRPPVSNVSNNIGVVPKPDRTINGSIKVEPDDEGNPEPVKVADPEPFGYTVSGVIVGRVPAVVFKDASGNQKLVTEGSSLDGNTKVEAVKLNYVAVMYRGKPLRLPVGGE